MPHICNDPPVLKKWPAYAAGLALAVGLSACSPSTARFLEEAKGFSRLPGRVVKIEGLSSNEITSLSDGKALRVDAPGCRVTLRYDETESQTITLEPGSVIVLGTEGDVVLRRVASAPEPQEPKSPEP